MTYDKVKYLPTVKRIPDELWDEIRLILPPEKPNNTIGRPVVSFRKGTGWHFVCVKNLMSMEDVAKGIWLWFNLS